jgi:hypothetical protein
MGWSTESAPGCEGYLVAIEPVPGHEWRYRELTHADDGHRGEVRLTRVQVGCECGWRSPRIDAPIGTNWYPSSVEAPAWFEEDARKRWHEHIDLETSRRKGGRP